MRATLVLPHPWERIHHQGPTLVSGPRKRHPLCKLEIQHPSSRAAKAGFAASFMIFLTLRHWKNSARMNLGAAWIVLEACPAW